jgi:hypothetical protein
MRNHKHTNINIIRLFLVWAIVSGTLIGGMPLLSQEQYSPGAPMQVRNVNFTLPFYFNSQPLSLAVINGKVILEGDIVLGPEAILITPPSDALAAAGITGHRWPNRRVPYTITAGHPREAIIRRAIRYVDSLTNITFVARTTETDYIEYIDGSGCWSSIGMQGGKQQISIGSGCGWGNAVHETCHALGLFHEQTRRDRDTYVRIDTANIIAGMEHNFKKYTVSYSGSDIGSYDFNSIMHYPPMAFSSNGRATIVGLVAGRTFGQRDSLSRGDIRGINSLYPVTTADALGYNIQYDVQLVPQPTSMSCWAASASMIVGWRENMSIDPQEIVNGIGHWRTYSINNGLPPDDTTMLRTWGFVTEPPMCYTVDGFRNLLARYGPLWVAAAVPGPHVRVVKGMSGDGSPDGTLIYINDPWERGMATFRTPNNGSTYTQTFREFMSQMESLGARESSIPGAIYIAHP